jgi:Fe-S-cluster containining protein
MNNPPANSTTAGAPGLASETREASSANPALPAQDAQLIQIVDAALADAARRSGPHLVCHPGCTPCCHGAFAINALDALRLRRAMTEMAATDPSRAKDVATRALQYLEEFAPSFPGNPQTGILDESEEAQQAFEDFANEAPCPALNPESGLCEVYAARPMTCRVFGPPVRSQNSEEEEGLSVCELCFTQATPEEIAAAEMQLPHAEEQALLAQLPAEETIVAFCLLPKLR